MKQCKLSDDGSMVQPLLKTNWYHQSETEYILQPTIFPLGVSKRNSYTQAPRVRDRMFRAALFMIEKPGTIQISINRINYDTLIDWNTT